MSVRQGSDPVTQTLEKSTNESRRAAEFEAAWQAALTGGPQPTLNKYLDDTSVAASPSLRGKLEAIQADYERRWQAGRQGSDATLALKQAYPRERGLADYLQTLKLSVFSAVLAVVGCLTNHRTRKDFE